MDEKKFTTKQFVEMALLTAVIVLMAFTPIGYIKTFGLEITLIVVPVTVGAVTLGPLAGAVLGAVFGITSFLQCFGMSAFGTMLLGIQPVFTFFVCVASRVLMAKPATSIMGWAERPRIIMPRATMESSTTRTRIFLFTVAGIGICKEFLPL